MPAIGDYIYGGYFAGWMDTTKGNIIAADASQTGAHYMLIVSPLSLEQASLQYKTAATAAPASSSTMWDGLTATVAMTGTTYPAANYCNGLSYPGDGGSQWYLPAMDELELLYRNLKPDTGANYVSSRSAGTFPGIGSSQGVNASSDPTGSAYTTGAPAQTSVALFQSGGAQALDVTGSYYWCSTEYSATLAWFQGSSGSYAGDQNGYGKNNTLRVRPVRRVLYVPPSSGATLAVTASTTSTGVVGKLTGAALAATVAVVAAGFVGVGMGASIPATATITASGTVAATGVNSGATIPATATVTAGGKVGTSTGAVLASTAATTAAGVVGLTSGASVPGDLFSDIFSDIFPGTSTVSITAAGTVGRSTGASVPVTVTIVAAGTVTGVASSSAASLPVTVTTTAAGTVGASTGSALTSTASTISSGVVGRSTGATLAASATITAAGTIAAPPVDITVTCRLDPRRWAATLSGRTKTGVLTVRVKDGTLSDRTKTGLLTNQRWKGTLS